MEPYGTVSRAGGGRTVADVDEARRGSLRLDEIACPTSLVGGLSYRAVMLDEGKTVDWLACSEVDKELGIVEASGAEVNGGHEEV
jgi:hypothetical protein